VGRAATPPLFRRRPNRSPAELTAATRCMGIGAGQVRFRCRVRRLQPNSNNNEALGGVALFRAGLTLETYVTGALNPLKCSASCERGSRMASETPLSDVRFLTVAEVALIMRVSKMTVYRLVHSGELEAIRVGRSFRVPEQAVNQYLRTAFVGTG
jgi:excisionase family DNA binding protein